MSLVCTFRYFNNIINLILLQNYKKSNSTVLKLNFLLNIEKFVLKECEISYVNYVL